MTTGHKNLLWGIGAGTATAAVLIYQILNGVAPADDASFSQKNASTVANVDIPAGGDPGIFKGKLETVALTSEDIPAKYGALPVDTNSTSGYLKDPKISPEDVDTQQSYKAPRLYQESTVGRPSVWVELNMQTFEDTSAAAVYYATIKQVSEISDSFNDESLSAGNIPVSKYLTSKTTFAGIGTENTATVGWYEPDADPDVAKYASKNWSIHVLYSNMDAYFEIRLPYTATDADVLEILKVWQGKIEAYQPGTAADIQAENAAGYSYPNN